jgi:pyruvate/2-oxoglutarate dehydrogenase complex dihydrolipoamide dehydrogenase (E3) component
VPVQLAEAGQILAREDRQLADILAGRLADEGVEIHQQALVTKAGRTGRTVWLELADGQRLEGTHLLVAAGREAVIDGLGLDKAGVTASPAGIQTDTRLRTSNRRIFAIGDVAGRQQFTHIAAAHASIAIRNILFRLPARLDERATVRVTYTDPELAQIGLTEAEAVEKFGADKIQLASWPLAENDRARAERRTEGLVKLVADRRGRLLGASILAPSAGEMIAVIAAAMAGNLKLAQLAGLVLPYPSYSEAIKRAAGNAFAARLFSPRVRQLVRLLLRLPR